MPYSIVKQGEQYCLQKEGGGIVKGSCHRDRSQTERMMHAIMAHESKALAVFKDADGARHMVIVTSNSYKDREGEYISSEALKAYVDSQWQGDQWRGDNRVLFWHKGPAIGKIVWADVHGPWLVEVARERASGLPTVQRYSKAIWDAVERSDIEWGASHGFVYRNADREVGEDGVTYRAIRKFETSVLPLQYAANALTYSGVLTDMANKERDEVLNKIAPGLGERLRRVLFGVESDLEKAGVEHKALGPTVTREDLRDVIMYSVQKALEKATQAKDGKDIDLGDVVDETLAAVMDAPETHIEDYEQALAVNEEGGDGETADAPEINKALADIAQKMVAFNEQLLEDQAALVKELNATNEALAALKGAPDAIMALEKRVRAMEEQFRTRGRASRRAETIITDDQLPSRLKGAMEQETFFGIPLEPRREG